MKASNYCGCCGRPSQTEWCDDCQKHVLEGWEKFSCTYYAQHDTACPFQVGLATPPHDQK